MINTKRIIEEENRTRNNLNEETNIEVDGTTINGTMSDRNVLSKE